MTPERLVKRHPSAPESLHSSTSGSLVATLLDCYTAPAKFCSALVRGTHFPDWRLDVDDRPAHLRLYPDSLA
jgi:hypothetical protein